MLTLYYAKGTAALPVHIALEEAGAEYDLKLMDFATKDHLQPDYLEINPKGRVPALVTEDGILTEAAGLLAYIGQRFEAADSEAAFEAMRLKVPQNMTDCATLIENRYLKGPWVMGAQYTICDPYLFMVARWLKVDGVDETAFPNILAHRARMEARPAVQSVMKHHE